RRYHSLLVAALPAPVGRTTMLNHLGETLRLADGTAIALGGLEPADGPLVLPEALAEFRLDNGRPVWRFEQAGVTLEKRIVVTHQQNTTRLVYRLLAGSAPATLVLEPAVDFRGHDDRVDRDNASTDYTITGGQNGVRIARADTALPPLHLTAHTVRGHVPFVPRPHELALHYRVEQARGYEGRGGLHGLGMFELQLSAGQEAVLTASTTSAACGSWPKPTRSCDRGWGPSWSWPPTSSSSARTSGPATRPVSGRKGTTPARSSPDTTGSPTGGATP